jgi:hypothetical protein
MPNLLTKFLTVLNPGRHAFAAAMDYIPAGRTSLTMRSCNVANAAFDASLRLRAVGADDVDVQRQQQRDPTGSPRRRREPPAVHPEDPVLVAVERYRLAMLFQISAGRPEVIKRRFRGDEPQLHQQVRRIIHETQQRAWRRGPRTRLRSEPLICTSSPRQSHRRRGRCGKGRRCQRSCVGDHPTALGLARHRTAMELCQLFRRQRSGQSRKIARARSTEPGCEPQRGARGCWACRRAWESRLVAPSCLKPRSRRNT